MGETVQGGRLAARAIAAEGVDTVFTLSGGHIMPINDGCRHESVRARVALERALASGEPAIVNMMIDPEAMAGHPYRGM